jgi:hypothetical protein
MISLALARVHRYLFHSFIPLFLLMSLCTSGQFLVTTDFQDTVYQHKIEAFEKEFSRNYDEVTYKKLPEFLRTYLYQLHDEDLHGAKQLFNASDAGFSPREKRYYIRRSGNDYKLNYTHKGTARHYHSIVFKTNGKEIMNVYNWVISMQMKVVEFSNWHLYRDTLLTILDEFSENNIRINSYKGLPHFIRSFLDHVNEEKFRISKRFYNAGCGGGVKRKLSYILRSGDNYILSYDHGGLGHHFHSVFFKTNGKEITKIYNVTNSTHRELSDLIELIELGWYYVQDFDEF